VRNAIPRYHVIARHSLISQPLCHAARCEPLIAANWSTRAQLRGGRRVRNRDAAARRNAACSPHIRNLSRTFGAKAWRRSATQFCDPAKARRNMEDFTYYGAAAKEERGLPCVQMLIQRVKCQ
jgi:hypothetical protein